MGPSNQHYLKRDTNDLLTRQQSEHKRRVTGVRYVTVKLEAFKVNKHKAI